MSIQKTIVSLYKDKAFKSRGKGMHSIKKILTANRGEIAVRIMRSAQEMGIKNVAVFSDADRNGLHVRFADEAIHIGPSPSSSSYLNMDKVIEAALRTGADAIHPGYGFLSENGEFARKVIEAGLVFIGPSPASIDTMGSKLAAKTAAAQFQVPLVPGTSTPIESIVEAKELAASIGYPILIKASAGGGGKGMRIVEQEKDFEGQLERATSEAQSSFGNGSVFIEKYIPSPRHIEFQILGDQQGNIVHLFERECSIQRRHQKVIEEAPSCILTPEKRKIMGEAAIRVARSCQYYGAGTVEFIVDSNLDFYFLEMNTRLQVEHPVTEAITGLDLVKLQIKIAQGESLPFRQEDLSFSGHALEIRVYAEDPSNGFLPDTGTLTTYRKPQGPGVRIDDGFEQGMEIPFYYDPMIAKLILHAPTRDEAIAKALRAIDEYEINGLKTTLPFARFVLEQGQFKSGDFNTHFVEDFFHPDLLHSIPKEEEEMLAALMAAMYMEKQKKTIKPKDMPSVSPWTKNR